VSPYINRGLLLLSASGPTVGLVAGLGARSAGPLLLQPLPLQLMMLIISMDRMDPESRPTAGETAAASCCF